MKNVYVKGNRVVHNKDISIPISSIKKEDRRKYSTIFSEGSQGLNNCLYTMWEIGLDTIGCCIGTSEEYREGFITAKEGVDFFRYLSSNILDDDMVRIWIDKTWSPKGRQQIVFAGSQERKEEILTHLAEDLLTGVKDNVEQVRKKLNKPLSSLYLLEKQEYNLRRKGLSEKDIAYQLDEYRQKLYANDRGKTV